MEDLIKEVEGRFKFSVADSTMMWLVQQAMDKAHEKIKSHHGAFARLNEISKFYELAVMQLDGCLKFVQQETCSYILESDHEEVLLDLREIRDRLHHRLLETELAILEKDRVLLERSENEQRLKKVLENKETELVHLQAHLERTRSEGVEEFIKGNVLEGTSEVREGEISELKCSVDQQVMNIRQKLEPEYESLTGEKLNSGVENKKIEKMGVDIDVLKGTMDLAFNKMHKAIFLSELGPIEQKWRWMIEKYIVAIVIKDFLEIFRNDFKVEKKKLQRKASVGLIDHISSFTEQILLIRREIECLAVQNEVIKKAPGCIGKSSSEGANSKNQRMQHEDEVTEEDNTNFIVATLIKNHESIIRRKSKELILPKLEPIKRQKSNANPRQRIDEIIARLDNLIESSAKLNENFLDDEGEMLEKTYPEKRVSGSDIDDYEEKVMDNLDDVWLKIHKRSVSDKATEIKMLRKEKEDAELRAIILEDTYLILLQGLVSGFHMDLQARDFWSLITEELYNNIIKEIADNRNEEIESEKIKSGLREDICRLVLIETIKYFSNSDGAASINCSNCIENNLKESINLAIFNEMLREWKKYTEICCNEEAFRREVDWMLIQEILEGVLDIAKHRISELAEEYEAKNTKAIEEERSRAHGLRVHCREISRVLEDFEFKIQEKLKSAAFMLENLEMGLNAMNRSIDSLRERESVYKKAFILKCENLIKAETEVDLLGDQVDAQIGLLQKILWTLHQHPLLLHHYPDLLEISRLTEKEVRGVIPSSECPLLLQHR